MYELRGRQYLLVLALAAGGRGGADAALDGPTGIVAYALPQRRALNPVKGSCEKTKALPRRPRRTALVVAVACEIAAVHPLPAIRIHPSRGTTGSRIRIRLQSTGLRHGHPHAGFCVRRRGRCG